MEQDTEVAVVSGPAGLRVNFALQGGCLFKANRCVYSKLYSKLWALSEELSVKAKLLINCGAWLPFRRVGRTEEIGRKGE